MGPALSSKYRADCLVWAQHWSQHLLPRALYGPRTGPKIWCQWPCMGPALASKCATSHLVWAQHWPQTLLLMVLYGPILVPYVLPVDLHKPRTGPKYSTDGIVWAQHWPQNTLPMAFYCSFYYMLQTSTLLLSHNRAT